MQQAVSGKRIITGFRDLIAWQQAHGYVLDIYKITRSFPQAELFALTSQLRRAVISITSNIAEGFSRPTSADKLHFYAMAQGSLTESQSQLEIAKDVGYISDEEYTRIYKTTITIHKLITGLIKSLKDGKGVK